VEPPSNSDLCVPLDAEATEVLNALGFRRDGRHWVHGSVAVEFPESRIDGDPARTHLETVGDGAARIIGVDDLYVDRLRQATAQESARGIEYHSALAVAAACYDMLDARYVRRRIEATVAAEPLLGASMKRVDARIRRLVRRTLGPTD
jgi:hypothetical protein